MKNITRIIISPYFDQTLPGGGSLYSTDLARVWLQQGVTVHVLSSDYRRKLLDLERYLGTRLFIHPISDCNRMLLSHVFDPAVYESAKAAIGRIGPESIHVHNFHGLLAAAWAAVESGHRTFYSALDFGLVCPDWYLYDGTSAACSGPGADKCRRCLLAGHRVSRKTSLLYSVAPYFTKFMGRDTSYLRQYALLNDYFEKVGEHLEKMLPLLKRFDAIFTISPVTGRVFEEMGVAREKIHLAVQGIKLPRATGKGPIRTGGVKLAYMGHLAPIKGFQVIVKALEALPDGLDLNVCIYGEGTAKFLRSQSAKARRYLTASGGVVGDQVEEELKGCDAMLMPSLWHENTPYAVLKTLSAGRPVMTSDIEGVTHLIKHGINGLIVPKGDVRAWRDTLEMVAKEPAALRKMFPSCAYTKTAEQYAAELEEVIAQVCSTGKIG